MTQAKHATIYTNKILHCYWPSQERQNVHITHDTYSKFVHLKRVSLLLI